jgi:hypothetical protein
MGAISYFLFMGINMGAIFNRYYIFMLKRFEKLDGKTRRRMLQQLICKNKSDPIFTPLCEDEIGLGDWGLDTYQEKKERRIRDLQCKYGDCFWGDNTDADQIKIHDIKGRWGRTPLHEAVIAEDLEEMEQLVQKGENVKIRDNNGHTPMQMAIFHSKKEVIERLNELGVST